MNRFSALLALAALAFTASRVSADIRLPGIFSEHAVLQRSRATTIWGWADPGEKVRASLGETLGEATADAEGKWRVSLDLSRAGREPSALRIEGKNAVTIPDVIVGEVWLTSGQSNMQLPLSATTGGLEEAKRSENPRLRWFAMETRGRAANPEEDAKGRWVVAGPGTSADCSAIAYYFGKILERDLDTSVGMILTAVGGSAIQTWMSPGAIEDHEDIKAALAKPAKKKLPPVLAPSLNFNRLIHPLAALSFQGVLWYQGEAHFSQGAFYASAFPALIRDWRRHFGKPELPFYFCQLPNLDKKTADANNAGWVAEVREAQDEGLAEPHTGEAVLIDVGAEDLHPPDKEVVARRLALLAEADVYGRRVECRGPRFQKIRRDGSKIIVEFADCPGGLTTKPLPEGAAALDPKSEVQGFALSNANGQWHWAQAKIRGNTTEVWSPEITEPAGVRYAWANNPTCNLYNKAGLPAAPFRSPR